MAEFLRHLPSLKPTVLNLEILAYLGEQESLGGPQTFFVSSLEEEFLKPVLAIYSTIVPEERVLPIDPNASLLPALDVPEGNQQRALFVTGNSFLA